MSYGPQHYWDPRLQPEPPAPRGRGWLWVALLVGGGVVLLGGGAIAAIWLIGIGPSGVPDDSLAREWETPEQKRAALRGAFDGLRHDVGDSEITSLLDQVVFSARASDDAGFRALFDMDRYLVRVETAPRGPDYTRLQWRRLRPQIEEELSAPPVVHLELVYVDEAADEEMVVYALASLPDGTSEPYRFWVCRTGEGLRLFDCERIEIGLSDAAKWARLAAANDDARHVQYERGTRVLHEVSALIAAGDQASAAERLKAVPPPSSVPRAVADYWAYGLAMRWSQLGDGAKCLEMCGGVTDPDGTPGVHALRAIWAEQTGDVDGAIKAVEDYERVVGFLPDMARIRARSLASLSRNAEAAAEWRRIIELSPENVGDLVAYLEALPAGGRASVLALIESTPSPPQLAAAVARLWARRGGDDDATLHLLARFVAERMPGSAEATSLEGTVLSQQGDYEAAAAKFLVAARTEVVPDDRAERWNAYLESMASAGRALEGYEAAPDPRAALGYLAEGIDADEARIDFDELGPLLDAHRRRAADDPRLPYYAGLLAEHEGDLALAEQELAQADRLTARSGDQELAYLVREHRSRVLYRLGDLAQACDIYRSAPDVYRSLASLCQANEDAGSLQLTLDFYRRHRPGDPWIEYYSAVLLSLSGRPEAALPELERLAAMRDEEVKGASLRLKAELLVDLGRWQEAYRSADDADDMFSALAWLLRERADWKSLGALCDMHRRHQPDDSQLLVMSVEAAFGLQDDERVVGWLSPWPKTLASGDYRARELRQRLVESLLRLGRTEEAQSQARTFHAAHRDPLPLLLVLDRLGQWDEMEKLLAARDAAEAFESALDDPFEEQFQAYRREEGAAALRRRFPPGLPVSFRAGQIVLFLRAPAELTAERLQALANSEGQGQASIRPLPSALAHVDAAFEVQTTAGRAVVSSGTGNDCDLRWLKGLRPRDAALATALREHGGWLKFEAIAPAGDKAPVRRLVRQLAAAFFGDDVQALYVSDAADGGRLAAAGPSTPELLRGQQRLDEAFASAQREYLQARSDGPQTRDRKLLAAVERVARAAAAAAPGAAPERFVRVRLRLGAASEDVWLRLVSARRLDYGSFRLHGEFLADSRLWPHLTQGSAAALGAHDVLELRADRP